MGKGCLKGLEYFKDQRGARKIEFLDRPAGPNEC